MDEPLYKKSHEGCYGSCLHCDNDSPSVDLELLKQWCIENGAKGKTVLDLYNELNNLD